MMDQSNKTEYTGVTIGPIVTTLLSAKSTKGTWAASYLFASFMRNLLDAFWKAHPDSRTDLLMPAFDGTYDEDVRAGLYPDRCILQGDYVATLESAKTSLITQLAKDIVADLESSKLKLYGKAGRWETNELTLDKVTQYLFEYLTIRIHLFRFEEVVENPVVAINRLLDTAELDMRPISEADTDFLYYFLDHVYYNSLVRERFSMGTRELFFPSTAEIAAQTYDGQDAYLAAQSILRSKEGEGAVDDPEAQQNFYDVLKKSYGDNFRNFQKYVAVIQADADNMRGVIQQIFMAGDDGGLSSEELFQKFSALLKSFSKEAVQMIVKNGGTSVFGGGDEQLFFAPVAQLVIENEGGEQQALVSSTVFGLIDKLDALFQKRICEGEFKDLIAKLDKRPTFSFGVSIAYYKFPFNEILSLSFDLMKNKAKSGDKNGLAWEVCKHSGVRFGTVMQKDTDVYKQFRVFLKSFTQQRPEGNVIKGVAFKLQTLALLLQEIGLKPAHERAKHLASLFKNQFNEETHLEPAKPGMLRKDRKLKAYLEHLKELILCIYAMNELSDFTKKQVAAENQRKIDQVVAILRLVNFIHNNEERDEF